MPFDYCKPEAQNQPNQGYTLIQQPQQQMATISPIINHHPQYTSIASSGSYLFIFLLLFCVNFIHDSIMYFFSAIQVRF